MTKQFNEKLNLDKKIIQEMEKLCSEKISELKFGTEFDKEVLFNDGKRMAIQVCASPEEPCWTQGVLFDKDGVELGCTDVSDSFQGTYSVLYENSEYSVTI